MPSIYQLQAPLLAMQSARLDSPVASNVEAYAKDKAFFVANQRRRLHLREDGPAEFDMEMPVGEFLQTPRLWNLIVRISQDVHLCVPLYRGKRFWDWTLKDDDAVSFVLVEIARREGIDVVEFQAFAERVNQNNMKFLDTNDQGQ